MKEYIEERAIAIANYIIDHNATVRQTAKRFGISKSTVHKVVTKWTCKLLKNKQINRCVTSGKADCGIAIFHFRSNY
ncbi:MAG: sporulation transcriptional regulator SpoIIID [Clostridium sp.]|nr:sporulation transcriptional regulator SpoIIID [Clostridium sp.]MDY5483201.1 sporulation transcriptional regulator SpoIIID [Clostridium sp.]